MASQPLSHITVLSIEQALTLPFLTYRLRQEGVRVIRVEHPRRPDPNRFIGTDVLGEEGMNAYFLQNNLGKEAITLNLKDPRGQALLGRLLDELAVDVFATNQLPKSYEGLGIAYETLSTDRPGLIWLGITGFGPAVSEPAYDPIIQARSGLMELTGQPDAPPTVVGVPLADLGASEHAFGQVMKALYQREVTGEGCRIDISMFHSSVSWLSGSVMFAMNFDAYHTRRGNTHEFFAPVSVFPASDGHLYLAVGNDAQWERLTGLPEFTGLAQDRYARNAGRIADVEALNRSLEAILATKPLAHWMESFRSIQLPVSRVNTLKDLVEEPQVRDRTIHAVDPRSGQRVDLPLAPVATDFLARQGYELSFPPRMGEHNEAVYGGVLGLTTGEIAGLREEGVL